MPSKKKKVLVAMSGGVDSSVAAALLQKQGYEVTGVFLHFWKEPGEAADNKCCSLESMNDAKAVCRQLRINFNSFDFSRPFKKEVVDYFLQEYQKGRTPNPCVKCNKKIKIGRLLDYALKLGFDYLATGHYLKLAGKKMFRAKDKNKDQSYFLYTFSQKQLKHLLFPLGNYLKPQVRKLAKKFSLPVAEKKESQEICFIAGKHHNDFLKKYLKLKPGKIIIKESGEVLGEHQGLSLYTIGQRRGIEIGGTGPYYVIEFDYQKNILYVAKKFDDQTLYGDSLISKNTNWLSDREPKMPLKCQAIIRYRHPAEKCEVSKKGKNYLVKFKKPQRAITPGQSVVFYQGQEVLGGGIIK